MQRRGDGKHFLYDFALLYRKVAHFWQSFSRKDFFAQRRRGAEAQRKPCRAFVLVLSLRALRLCAILGPGGNLVAASAALRLCGFALKKSPERSQDNVTQGNHRPDAFCHSPDQHSPDFQVFSENWRTGNRRHATPSPYRRCPARTARLKTALPARRVGQRHSSFCVASRWVSELCVSLTACRAGHIRWTATPHI